MGVFVEILQHLMTLTFPNQWDIGGITVQDGIVTVKTGSDWQGTGRFWNLSCNERVWRRFDHGLADPDISMAALMHISTFVNSLSVTSLFEMLFRRKYSPSIFREASSMAPSIPRSATLVLISVCLFQLSTPRSKRLNSA
jgi:hypothetical protein